MKKKFGEGLPLVPEEPNPEMILGESFMFGLRLVWKNWFQSQILLRKRLLISFWFPKQDQVGFSFSQTKQHLVLVFGMLSEPLPKQHIAASCLKN